MFPVRNVHCHWTVIVLWPLLCEDLFLDWWVFCFLLLTGSHFSNYKDFKIRLEITLRLVGPDVFFLPQTCLTCFQNLISLSCCNHVFEDIFTVMNKGNVHSLWRQQTYLTDILMDLQISGLPEWKTESLILWLHLIECFSARQQ